MTCRSPRAGPGSGGSSATTRNRAGRGSSSITGSGALATLAALMLAACGGPAERRVDPAEHAAFWLWVGPAPREILAQAQELYLLDGEVLDRDGVRFRALRPEPPRLPGKRLWLVFRTDTL